MYKLLEKLTQKEIMQDVIRRNVVYDSLKDAKNNLQNGRFELGKMVQDDCHIRAHFGINVSFGELIKEIDSMMEFINSGDWCFSKQSTKEVEDKM